MPNPTASCSRSLINPPHPIAPGALDESRDTVHGVAVVRQYAAHAPLHVSELPVTACEHQKSALAFAVVREGNLCECHACGALRVMSHDSRVTSQAPAPCAQPCQCGS